MTENAIDTTISEEESDLKEGLQASIQSVEERLDEARDMIQKYNEKVVDLVSEKPLVAVAGAFAIGYVIGKLAAHRWFV